MAISFDVAASLGTFANNATTGSFTIGSGTNRILFVSVEQGGSSAEQVTAISTSNAQNLTKIATASHGTQFASLWYLVNPTSGSTTLSTTTSGGATYGINASAYAGAKQTGVPDASITDSTSNAAAGNPGAYNITLTTVADNCWIIAAATVNGTWNSNGGASTTRGLTASGQLYDKGPYTPAGSNVIGATTSFSGGGNIAAVAASFAPAVAGGPLFCQSSLSGIGSGGPFFQNPLN